MMKYLVLLALIAAVWWRWRKNKRPDVVDRVPVVPPAEDMVACAHCGVYLPQSEALAAPTAWYCCAAHRVAGPRPPNAQ